MRQQLMVWMARSAIAALLLAAIEIAWVMATVPIAGSNPVGALLATHIAWATFFTVLVPVGIGSAWLEHRGLEVPLPTPATWVTGALIAVAITGTATTVFDAVAGYPEFPDRLRSVANTTLVVATFALLVVGHSLVLPFASKHLGGVSPRPVAAVGLLIATLLAFAIAYLALGPVMLDDLAAIAVAAAAVCALFALRVSDAKIEAKQARIAALGALGALVLAPVSCGHGHAGYLFFTHARAAGPLGATLLSATDLDGDGSAASLLGGADCAEGDASRGPFVREVKNDGVDQDCQGGDAPASGSTSSAPSPLLFACAKRPRMPVVLITLDAVGDAPLSPELTPNITRLGQTSRRYARAYSGATSTVESVTTLFAGRSLSDLAKGIGDLGVPPKLLPTQLTDAGYRALAVENLGLPEPLVAGFATTSPWWRDSSPRDPKELFESSVTTEAALRLLARPAEAPLFLWAHYADAHAPYLPLQYNRGEVSPYEREVAYVDFHVGRLLDGMARLGQIEDTIIILSADHGEEQAAHGLEGHGPLLYEASVNVPLIVRVPGCAPQVIDEPVSLTQLASALLAYAGIDQASPMATAENTPFAVSEGWTDAGIARTLVTKRYKLIVDVHRGHRVLFDLEADPDEYEDIAGSQPDALARMNALYQAWLDR